MITRLTSTMRFQSGDSSELAPRLPCKGKSVRNRGVSQTMPFLVIPRSLLRGGFIDNPTGAGFRVRMKVVKESRAITGVVFEVLKTKERQAFDARLKDQEKQ